MTEPKDYPNFLTLSHRFRVEVTPECEDRTPGDPRFLIMVGRRGIIRSLPDNFIQLDFFPGQVKAFKKAIRLETVDWSRTRFNPHNMTGTLVLSMDEFESVIGILKLYVNVRNDENFVNNRASRYLKARARMRDWLHDNTEVAQKDFDQLCKEVSIEKMQDIIVEHARLHPIPYLIEEQQGQVVEKVEEHLAEADR